MEDVDISIEKNKYGSIPQPDTGDANPEETRIHSANFCTLITCWGTFLATLDASLLDVCVVAISKDFEVELSWGQWVLLIYMLTEAALFPLCGKLGDRFNKKIVYQSGMVLFLASSVACSFAPNFYALVAFRCAQGVSSAMMVPLGLALVTRFCIPEQRTRAIGNNSVIVGTGLSLGPPLGGFLTNSFGWRRVFYVNIPIGIIGFLIVQRYLPNCPSNPKARLDPVGALLFLCTNTCLLVAVSFYGEADDSIVVAIFGGFLVLSIMLYVWLHHFPFPLIPLRVLTSRVVWVSVTCSFMMFFCVPIIRFLMPTYLQKGLGWNPFDTGLFQMALSLSVMLAGPLSGWMVTRCGVKLQTSFGLLLFLSGVVTIALSMPLVPVMVVGVSLCAFGVQTFFVPNVDYLMSNCNPEDTGITAALNSVSRSTAFPMGIAVITLLLELFLEGGDTAEKYTFAARFTCLSLAALPIACLFLTMFVRPTSAISSRRTIIAAAQISVDNHSMGT